MRTPDGGESPATAQHVRTVGMRGLYSHVSQRMREDLKQALQARWEESLNERAALSPTSPVPAFDNLLAPIRDRVAQASPGPDEEEPTGRR